METARLATAADLDRAVDLWQHAVAELDGQRGGGPLAAGLSHSDLQTYVSAGLGGADRAVVMGLIDAVPVGVASLLLRRDSRESRGELELIYVEPTARQVGVAEAMLDTALEQCARWGVSGLDAPALPGNRRAKSFFETNGFQARLLIMYRRVP